MDENQAPLLVHTAGQMRRWSAEQHAAGRRIVLVPTMGCLHAGHLSLVRLARQHGQSVVVSIFVNPTQFGPAEDFARYPRTLESDVAALREVGVDAVFVPEAAELYPPHFQTMVVPGGMAEVLCGASRPGHFRGVCTVVALLFRITQCDVAVFGAKDHQQLAIIRRMTRDLWLDVEIVEAPIVRDVDGVALSSRNRYLLPAERAEARLVSQALARVEALWHSGERDPEALMGAARRHVEAGRACRIDYIALVDAATLAPWTPGAPGAALCALAVFVGETRLIDNRLLPHHKWSAASSGSL